MNWNPVLRVHPVNVVAVLPVYVTCSLDTNAWPKTSTVSVAPTPIVPVVGNPVVDATVIVVAVLVNAPLRVVLWVLPPVGFTLTLTSTLSKKAYTLVFGFIPVAVKLTSRALIHGTTSILSTRSPVLTWSIRSTSRVLIPVLCWRASTEVIVVLIFCRQAPPRLATQLFVVVLSLPVHVVFHEFQIVPKSVLPPASRSICS